MNSLKQLRPVVKPVVREVQPLDAWGFGLIEITLKGRTFRYVLQRLPADFGDAFAVRQPGESEGYHLMLAGRQSTCECLGFLRWGKCKHLYALLELEGDGRLGKSEDAPVNSRVHRPDLLPDALSDGDTFGAAFPDEPPTDLRFEE